jgi:hypothetical protein
LIQGAAEAAAAARRLSGGGVGPSRARRRTSLLSIEHVRPWHRKEEPATPPHAFGVVISL